LHRASNITKLSAQLVKQAQASVGLVNWFSAQVRRSVADAISSAVLAGSGTNSQPLGIVNAPQGSSGDINTITLSNPTTWAQLVAADSTVENLNAYSIDGTSGWIVNSNTKASWAVTPKTPTALTNGFLFNPESKTVNGHKTFVSKEIGNFAIFASRWSSILVVLGGATSVLVDPYTQAHVNNVRVITDSLVDVVFRRRETICVAATTF
jgi:HK97 family phage major capsid protein